jgi:hypothetical protein
MRADCNERAFETMHDLGTVDVKVDDIVEISKIG